MHGIILATGEDDHLAVLTTAMPSAMLPIANRPALVFQIELLARYGVKRATVCLHQHGNSVEAYCGDGRRWGVQMEYSLQNAPLGDAGAIQWARATLARGGPPGTLVLLPGNQILDVDVQAALACHQAGGNSITLILRRPDSGAKGDAVDRPVALDGQGKVTAVGAQASGAGALAFTGAAILEPAVLEHLARGPSDLYSRLAPDLLRDGLAVGGYEMDGYWNRLNTFEAYQEAQAAFLLSAWSAGGGEPPAPPNGRPRIRFPALEAPQIAPGVWAGKNNAIHPNVKIAPPVYIGDRCQVGSEVELGPGAVLGSNVIVDDGATIHSATILDNTYVGRLVNLDQRIVSKATVVDTRTSEVAQVVDRFLLADNSASFAGAPLARAANIAASLALLLATLPVSIVAGLLALLASGRLVRKTPLARPRPDTDAAGADARSKPRAASLITFETCRAGGSQTALGRWLSRWELDRLPLLWNVLGGQLSLVGVKPLTPEEAALVTEDWQKRRFACAPGFTGLWYIQTGPGSALDEALVADAYYAATRHWREDVSLVWKTPRAWMRRARRAS